MKRFVKIFSLVLLLLGMAIGGTLIYFYYNQDKLIRPFVNQLNKNLTVEVKVESIHLSFRKFPYAAVAFENVYCPEAVEGSEDTLFSVRSVYLLFNLRDLLADQIQVRSVRLEEGVLRIKKFSDGRVNYRFWRDQDEEGGELALSLKEVAIRDVDFMFVDEKEKIHLHDYVHFMDLNGNFSQENYRLEGKGKIQNKIVNVPGLQYDLPVVIESDFVLESEGEDFHFQARQARIEKQAFSLRFFMQPEVKEFHLQSTKMPAASLVQLMPHTYRNAIDWFELSGQLEFEFNMELPYGSAAKSLLIFSLENGAFVTTDKRFGIDKLHTFGELSWGMSKQSKNGLLHVQTFQGKVEGGSVDMSLRLEDFDRPFLELQANAEIPLANLLRLSQMDTILVQSGNVKLDLQFANRFSSLKNPTRNDFNSARASGNLHIENGKFRFVNGKSSYEQFQASMRLEKNDLALNNFQLISGESDIQLNGRAENLVPFLLLDNQHLRLKAKLSSSNLLLDELMSGESSDETPFVLQFPQGISFGLETDVAQLTFKKFKATSVRGNIAFSNGIFSSSFSQMQTLGGKLDAVKIEIDGKNPPFDLRIQASGKDLDMEKIFYTFEDFGQDVLSSRQLKGKLSADVHYQSRLQADLSIPLASVKADAHVRIANGRLLNFAPMEALSRFARMDEIKDVHFDEMSNTLQIRDQKLFIPMMEIKSNVVNMEIEGNHSFENEIDYTVRIDLRELIFTERKRRKKDFEDIMVFDEGKGARLWVKMTGTASDPIIKMDNSQIGKTLREQWKEQGRELRNPREEKPARQYEYEWEED